MLKFAPHIWGTEMFKVLNTLLIGITAGSIYSLMAISMVLVWRSTRVVNFAQAGMALASTFIGYEIMTRSGNFWIALIGSLIAGALISAFIEILLMRTLVRHSSQGPIASVAPIIATLGLLGLIKSVLTFLWGGQDRLIPPPVSNVGYSIGSQTLAFSPLKALILGIVVLLVLALTALFQKSNIGLALRASAYNPEISRLAGLRVDGLRTFGWALAGAAGAAAGMLQTPNGSGAFSSESIEFSLLLVFGFIAAVIGGLESLVGAIVGGLVLGIVLAFVLTYISGSLVYIVAFVILVAVLAVKPEGIISSQGVRRA